jgi:hypothetical protein
VSFEVSADAYLQFMGRYSEPLAGRFADLAEVREVDPGASDLSGRPGAREGHLASLFAQAGLTRVQAATLAVRVRHAGFEHWWEPLTLGVSPAGEYVQSLGPDHRDALRSHCRNLLPAGPFETTATAWAATSPALPQRILPAGGVGDLD